MHDAAGTSKATLDILLPRLREDTGGKLFVEGAREVSPEDISQILSSEWVLDAGSLVTYKFADLEPKMYGPLNQQDRRGTNGHAVGLSDVRFCIMVILSEYHELIGRGTTVYRVSRIHENGPSEDGQVLRSGWPLVLRTQDNYCSPLSGHSRLERPSPFLFYVLC